MRDEDRLRTIRRRIEDLTSALDRRPRPRSEEQPAYIGQVYDGGSLPTTLDPSGTYFLTHPVSLSGDETAGGTGTVTADSTRSVPVLVVGNLVPVVDDVLIARLLTGGRWVAESRADLCPDGGVCAEAVDACSNVSLGNATLTLTSADGLRTYGPGMSAGPVVSMTRVAIGSGYTNGSFTDGTFTGGGGTGATFSYTVVGGNVGPILTVTNGGTGYTTPPTPVFPNGGHTPFIPATATATIAPTYCFGDVPSGNYTLSGSATNYVSGSKTITLPTTPKCTSPALALVPYQQLCWQVSRDCLAIAGATMTATDASSNTWSTSTGSPAGNYTLYCLTLPPNSPSSTPPGTGYTITIEYPGGFTYEMTGVTVSAVRSPVDPDGLPCLPQPIRSVATSTQGFFQVAFGGPGSCSVVYDVTLSTGFTTSVTLNWAHGDPPIVTGFFTFPEALAGTFTVTWTETVNGLAGPSGGPVGVSCILAVNAVLDFGDFVPETINCP